MILGTICRIINSSPESLKIYGKMKATLPFLVCPCIWKGQIVIVQEILSKKHCVISLHENEKLMSVCSIDDLQPIN